MAALLPSTEDPTQTPDNSSQAGNSVVETQNTLQQASIDYKSILFSHARKSHILKPTYEVSNEGPANAPLFRATVLVGGKRYTSHTTFTHRKAAEQDAAKIAWDDIAPKTDDEEKLPDIEEYALFCKSILYQFAAKMHFDNPTFNTLHPDALVCYFKSVVTFNGKSYTGEPGKTKKEAERLAARATILSLLESELKNDLSKVIKSKSNAKLFAKLNNVQDSSHFSTTNSSIGEVASMNNAIGSSLSGLGTVSSALAADPPCHDTGKGVLKNNDDGSSQPGLVHVSSAQVVNLPDHEFNKPAVQSSTVSVAQPKSFVPPSVQQQPKSFVHPSVQQQPKSFVHPSVQQQPKSFLHPSVQQQPISFVPPWVHQQPISFVPPWVQQQQISFVPPWVQQRPISFVPPWVQQQPKSFVPPWVQQEPKSFVRPSVQQQPKSVVPPSVQQQPKSVVPPSVQQKPKSLLPPSVQHYMRYVHRCGQKRKRDNE